MTDSPSDAGTDRQKPAKRERLVEAARVLLHQQGIERTTIAEIAEAADVPLGNVYYYFKTKDDIIGAVVDAHVRDIEDTIETVNKRHRTPRGRLKALVEMLSQQGQSISQHGCPYGTLCAELDKRIGGPDPAAARLMAIPIEWAEQQFRSMGRPDAPDLAVELISRYQGAALLTNALGNPALLSRQARRIGRWIDSLEST